jgi:hypothetical protein
LRHSRFQVFFTLLLLPLTAACKKPDSGSAAPAAAPPSAPATLPPSFSAAQKIGMFAYAKNNQTNDQRLRDEHDCYTQFQQQTGINPDTPAPSGPSAADLQAAEQQGAANAPQARGGRARGAARGAVGGAIVGGIVGEAGKGAAIGAVGGTMRGGRRQRQANEQSQQQAAQSAGAQVQRQYSQAKAAYNQIKKEES